MIKSRLYKTALTFGLINAGVCILYFLILYFWGKVPLGNKKLPDIGFHIIFVAGALWQFKKENGGYLHTWQGISLSYVTNIFSTLVLAVFMYIFVKLIDPDVLVRYINDMRTLLQNSKNQHIETFGQASYTDTVKQIQLTNAGDIFWDEITKKTFFMVIPIFILSAIFRKIRPDNA